MNNPQQTDSDKIIYGIRENTPMGSFSIANNLQREEAMILLRKLENSAKANGTYFEDRFVLTYRRQS